MWIGGLWLEEACFLKAFCLVFKDGLNNMYLYNNNTVLGCTVLNIIHTRLLF